jgi:glutaminyl-tRNA synthetase
LKDAGKKKAKGRKYIDESQKEINKFKEKDVEKAAVLQNLIVDNIKSIDNYSLIIQTVSKKLCDNNALLFANLIFQHASKNKFDKSMWRVVFKLFNMLLKSNAFSSNSC